MSKENISKENLNSVLRKTDVSCSFYYFDINRRVYVKNGVKSNASFYEEHFVKINIIDENDKEYIDNFRRTINKRSMLYKINNTTRVKVFTEQEKEDDIYVNSKSYKLAEMVRKSDADTLRKIEALLS